MVMIVFQALLEIAMKKLNAGKSMKPKNGSYIPKHTMKRLSPGINVASVVLKNSA